MCSLCRLPVAKNYNFGQIFGSCIDALLPMTATFGLLQQTNGLRLLAKFRLDRFILSSSGGEKPPIFAIFWTLAFSGVTNWQQSDKVEHVCTTTNLPLSNGIKIVSVLERLYGKIRCTISDIQKCDGQTAKKNSMFLATPAAGETRTPPNLAW